MVTERLSLAGDLLDKNTLGKVLDVLNAHGVKFQTRRFKVGEFSDKPTIVDLHLTAPDVETMRRALEASAVFGALYSLEEVTLVEADMDGVLPEGFHSTSNFTTHIHIKGQFVEVENLEMDCGIRVWDENGRYRATTCPMHRVRAGDRLVVGFDGVRISPAEEEQRDDAEFRFMSNEVSSERPKRRMIEHAARAIQKAKEEGKRVLFVGGPAIVHSGSAPFLARLIEKGWIDILFAGNALAAHDIEANMLGTSLGVDLRTGGSSAHGHTHHLRAINRVRRAGSIANAIEQGLISGGVMHACVKHGIPFVLAGSIRDDGPLPDVITDGIRAQDAMRAHISGVGVCLMVATTLHSVATGNILPASVKTYCVDSDADSVIKLTDRGTHQAIGLVTDCEFFLTALVAELAA
ncbi:TIGR00300 family protein [Fimbriimonas ginsengisoli]|uniref:ornithine cyclodeaminase n=1 Tax=Fimbriimonas ginsengisoli Gsoil 348 TaxID=661478 RepID=A0A068NUF9_FIMGI|nr:TIGR00300 family protein [Fimbriimonas ginsengisoli]AIE86415.1 LOR/SDH bifunctional enzyme conserved domain protein [Fimbriimonas ginsengisoli Gsoil 348]